MKKGRLALEILTIMLGNFFYAVGIVSVSYTHLTLPTIYSV
ncbi:hypothetical protein BN3590_00248 [Clostridium sp. C105KSO15]|nr:hypothetical protein BN3590_00248 [Clostridium sp. C105KSO15]